MSDRLSPDQLKPEAKVWAKVPTHPFWPAKVFLVKKIEAIEDLPSFVLAERPRGDAIPVYFFGTSEFGWIPTKDLLPYENHMYLANKCKKTAFLKALKEIGDRELWPERGEFKEQEITVQPVSEEEEEEPPKKVVKRKRQSLSEEKPKKIVKKESQRRQTAPVEPLKRKPSQKDKLLRLRMKLQLFLQKKDAYEVMKTKKDTDYAKADEYLTETENIVMNIELFKETKIAKVIKHLAKKDISEKNISVRCQQLTDRWVEQLQAISGGKMESDVERSGSAKDGLVSSPQKFTTSPSKEAVLSPKKELPESPTKETAVVSPVKSPKKDAPTSPKKDAQASPKKELIGSPKKDKVDSPKKEHDEIPIKESIGSPKKELLGSPKKDQPGSPKKETIGSPSKEQVESPKKDQIASPKKETIGSPSKEQVESPKKDQIGSPKKDIPLSPKKQNPDSPNKELKSPSRLASPKKDQEMMVD